MTDNLVMANDVIGSNMDENGLIFKLRGVTSEGDRVAIEAESIGTLKSGAVYHNFYHFLFAMRDGKIAEIREYNDTAHARETWGQKIWDQVKGRQELFQDS